MGLPDNFEILDAPTKAMFLVDEILLQPDEETAGFSSKEEALRYVADKLGGVTLTCLQLEEIATSVSERWDEVVETYFNDSY